MPLHNIVIEQTQFKAVVNTLKSPGKKINENISHVEFFTQETAYRPTSSDLINSFDTPSGIVDVYIFESSKYILLLSTTDKENFKHSLFKTSSKNGFTINELFKIISTY